MSREELSELWGVLRQLGWFSLLQDAFSTVMFANVLAYVRRRCVVFLFTRICPRNSSSVYVSDNDDFTGSRTTRRGVRRSS